MTQARGEARLPRRPQQSDVKGVKARLHKVHVGCLLAFVGLPLVAVCRAAETNAPPLAACAEGLALRETWESASYEFTPAVKAAFLTFAQAQARRDLTAAGKTLPSDLLAWVDGDPIVAATVYGARRKAGNVLLMLRSLELDLGQKAVRKDYTQLALATAVVFAKDGESADLSPRPPLKLTIGGDPRKPVDTRAKDRPLDLNDHIINFLSANTVEEDVVVGQREELPELKYDEKGVAIPPPKKHGKPKMVPVTERRTRALYAADVIASRPLQEKFNAYLKQNGQTNQIDCGDQVIHWKSRDMVRGEQHKKIAEAYQLFRSAYEAKGLLPAQRDPIPTPAERCAYLIRNDGFRFPADVREQRQWPRYPLAAPWPTLTLLVANDQPLREREERWEAFRDAGEFKTYGEYIGGVAQQFDMQSARRIKPYAFTYGSIQMMLKDGGVCGTMANISARSHCTLGVPACTAGQPGHCALIVFDHDPKTGAYRCHGAQYATGGDDKTHPHTPWIFGDVDARRPMVYYQSVAWAVNNGLASYLDSLLAYAFYRRLDEADRTANGLKLLKSGLALNPYNLQLADAGFEQAVAPVDAVRFWVGATKPFSGLDKPGCPTNGLYATTLKQKMYAAMERLPVPEDAQTAKVLLEFLQREACDNQATLAKYKVAASGLTAFLDETRAALKAHLESARTEAACDQMAAAVKAAADLIADKKSRREWAGQCWQMVQGSECYFGKGGSMTSDSTVAALAKLAGQKPRPEDEQFQPLLDQVVAQLKTGVADVRTPKGCARQAKTIETVANQLKSPEQKRAWLVELSQTLRGREDYTTRDAKRLRDPCADSIDKLLNATALEVPKP